MRPHNKLAAPMRVRRTHSPRPGRGSDYVGFCPDGLRSGMKWQNHPVKAPHFPKASLRGWELGERGGGLWMWVLLLWPRNRGTRQPENASLKRLCVLLYHLCGRVAFASRSQMRRPASYLQQPLRSSQSPVPSNGV